MECGWTRWWKDSPTFPNRSQVTNGVATRYLENVRHMQEGVIPSGLGETGRSVRTRHRKNLYAMRQVIFPRVLFPDVLKVSRKSDFINDIGVW